MQAASIARTDRRGWASIDLTYTLFIVFLVAALWLFLDPLYTGYGEYRVTRALGPLQYAALTLALGTSVLAIVGLHLVGRRLPRTAAAALRMGWPILVLGAYVLCGAAYARWYLGVQDTFLSVAVGTFAFPVAVVLYFSTRFPHRLVASFFWGLLIASPYAIGWIVLKRIEGGQAFHTEIFLIVPLAVYFFQRMQATWIRWSVVSCMIVTGLATDKLTGYVTLLITCAFLVGPPAKRRFQSARIAERLAILYVALIAAMLLIGGVVFLIARRQQYLPGGSAEVRSQTYLTAWDRFVASPIYGDGFTTASWQWLTGLHVLGEPHIGTHSDMLDLLSHGGIIAIVLYGFGISRVVIAAGTLKRLSAEASAEIRGLTPIVICGVFATAFNSPFLSVQISTLFWFAFGLLAAIAASARYGWGTTILPAPHVAPRRWAKIGGI